MRSIKGVRQDRRILLDIQVFASRDPNDFTNETYTALLDTGATASWVSGRIVERFGLVRLGSKPVVVATEVRLRESYIFRLGLVGDEEGDTALPFVFAETVGFKIDQADGFDVLLGMDVLAHTDFTMKRNGSWELVFG